MKLPLPRNLSGRLVLLLFLALVIAQLFSLFIFAHERHQIIENGIRDYMQDRSATVASLMERSPKAWQERILRSSSRGRLRFNVYANNPLLDTNEGVLTRLHADELPEDFMPIHKHKPPPETGKPDERSLVAMSLRLTDGRWLLAVKPLPDPPRNWAKSTLISLLFAVMLAVLLVWITSHWITRPLARLAQAAEALGRGERTYALEETGPADIQQTTHAFNQMRERLERFVSDRTRMLAAISHDLRTPLTALRLRAEFIEDEENRDKILATLDEVQAMTEATLAFAKSEHNNEDTRALDLSALIDALCEDYRALGHDIEFSPPGRKVCRCRPLAIKRALRNLMDNALAYGGHTELQLNDAAGALKITVSDSGPGIADADLARVFDPFVRLEQSRSRDTGGMGLGLSIARTIVHAHGGELTLKNRTLGGLEARITLPVAAT